MAQARNQPKNLNYFIPTGFRFMIDNIPHVNFFCQSANLPGVSMGTAIVPTPFRDYPIAGDKAQFNELRIRFVVDEELRNWLEIYNWIIGLTFPNDFSQYAKLIEGSSSYTQWGDRYSDGNLFVLTSNKNVQYVAKFTNMFPIDLTDIDMDAAVSDTDAVVADATFAYTTYNIERTIGDH